MFDHRSTRFGRFVEKRRFATPVPRRRGDVEVVIDSGLKLGSKSLGDLTATSLGGTGHKGLCKLIYRSCFALGSFDKKESFDQNHVQLL